MQKRLIPERKAARRKESGQSLATRTYGTEVELCSRGAALTEQEVVPIRFFDGTASFCAVQRNDGELDDEVDENEAEEKNTDSLMTSINRKVYYKKFNSRKDYYSVLALTSDASNEVMRKSYHKLVLIWHPDELRKDKTSHIPRGDSSKTKEAVQNWFKQSMKPAKASATPVTRAEYDYHRAVYKEIIKAYKILVGYNVSPMQEASRRKLEGLYLQLTTE
ncbi:hypothetical protein FIV31_07875 [Coxiella endosymbiont of Ornithodoros amblus]|uniref:DnaJ domain-containing protein n=1 Tax=Coxiella endosymbiont of Ornithodoros amblus TaxID=1656166 RepID=UPI00244DE14B|nr:DnaJ domain-containing protein [Coxiella endosymbiont of Ornithodoros amblus]MBW5803120.1 hypothetical protein [Coxiella endosymbiont of Ornithodoros amblus]